ncbi:hypothetical protein AAFF_G00401120 [Aldrovandia affinis]|uniref:Uncharacterized protein n=1 Tax=Aldrovandia affinis TaxID=143900 RepID=A0AAD7SCX2_9TELE|nr:hypothetical protein AAFF_G00401120 [Aldrovandia affinis]
MGTSEQVLLQTTCGKTVSLDSVTERVYIETIQNEEANNRIVTMYTKYEQDFSATEGVVCMAFAFMRNDHLHFLCVKEQILQVQKFEAESLPEEDIFFFMWVEGFGEAGPLVPLAQPSSPVCITDEDYLATEGLSVLFKIIPHPIPV